MNEERKKEVKSMYEPLREWIHGNPQIDNNMKVELLDIVHDMVKQTIDECYGKMKQLMEKKKK